MSIFNLFVLQSLVIHFSYSKGRYIWCIYIFNYWFYFDMLFFLEVQKLHPQGKIPENSELHNILKDKGWPTFMQVMIDIIIESCIFIFVGGIFFQVLRVIFIYFLFILCFIASGNFYWFIWIDILFIEYFLALKFLQTFYYIHIKRIPCTCSGCGSWVFLRILLFRV